MAVTFLAQGIEAASSSTDGLADSDACINYPGSNLLDRNQHTLWKAGSANTHFIRIDMGADYTASGIALINGNPYTGGAYNSGSTWRLEVKSDDNFAFSSPTTRLSTQIATSADEPIWYETFTAATDRYWRITVYDPVDCITQFGYPLLGTPRTFTLHYDRPRAVQYVYGTNVFETSGGQKFSNKRYGLKRQWDLNWQALSVSDKTIAASLIADVEGNYYPFLFKDSDNNLHWVRCRSPIMPLSEDVHEQWSFGLNLEEEL